MGTLDLTNQFLIAMPSLADPNFEQSVAYVCVHNDEGAMGVVINRPLPFNLGKVLAQMDIEPGVEAMNDTAIYQGGPVQQDRGFIIHNPTCDWESTIEISDELAIATSRDILEAISNGQGPKHSLIALGYAGWNAGQLEQEFTENAWLNTPADAAILFETPPELRWQQAAALVGVDLTRMSPDVGHA